MRQRIDHVAFGMLAPHRHSPQVAQGCDFDAGGEGDWLWSCDRAVVVASRLDPRTANQRSGVVRDSAVTFVVSLVGRDTVWLLADRRISWPDRHSDHGVKVMTLDTTDAKAVLGYCGLGETCAGTQPSAWMHDVLEGWDMSMNDALWKLAVEHQDHFPRHLAAAPSPGKSPTVACV
jgi:hypothetical protein